MIDIHCHLNFHSYENDTPEVIKNAFAAGVRAIVNVGTKLDSSKQAVELAHQYDNLWAIVGVHPHHADKVELGEDWIKELEILATDEKVIGIGEIGMDYYSYQSNGIVESSLQKEVFEAQIELAHRQKLPLQIHHRQVGQELIDILLHHKNLLLPIPGMFHCFAGSKEFLKQALDLGFFIGFDGNVTYKGIPKGETVSLRELAEYTPLDRIVTETDSPYLTPEPFRGQRNESKHVILVGEFLADLKGVTNAEMSEITVKNVLTAFPKLKLTL